MLETTGKTDFKVGKEMYQTCYKLVGDLASGVCPLVTLHGGPGISHEYMMPHVELYYKYNIPVIFYDQIGTGSSAFEGQEQKPKEFWSLDLFMDELENLLAHLGVQNEFDLLGHSWGAMLGVHYASHRPSPGLRRLVLCSGTPSMALWEKSTHKLLRELPDETREMLERHEKEGTTDSAEYRGGIGIFHEKHVCKSPFSKELNASLASMMANPTVYHMIIGASDFCITGTLKSWSCLEQLHKITNTTLITNGLIDEAQDVCVKPLFLGIPKSKWVQFKGRHIPFQEEEDKTRYFEVVGDFLTAVWEDENSKSVT